MAELSDKALRGVGAVADMLGAEAAKRPKAFALSDGFGAKMTAQALEFAYADNWDETGLSRRERSLILIGALVARQPNELRNHVALGLANGIAPHELEQILLQLVPYVGFPATSTASAAMRELMANAKKDAAHEGRRAGSRWSACGPGSTDLAAPTSSVGDSVDLAPEVAGSQL